MDLEIPASAIVADLYVWQGNTDKCWLHLKLAADEALREAATITHGYVLVTTAGSTILYESGEVPPALAATDFAEWRASATIAPPQAA